jgi:hypothetical protein
MRRAGTDGGSPEQSYDEAAFLDRLPELIRRIRGAPQERLDYDRPAGGYSNSVAFYIAEAFEHTRLRQGWGVPALGLTRANDVAKDPNDWIMDYLFALYAYWSEIEVQTVRGAVAEVARRLAREARRASGRYGVLRRMLLMSPGDLIFVPRTSADLHRSNCFTVGVIAGRYRFDDRAGQPRGTWLRDYGHIVPVQALAAYPYSNDTLLGTDFRPFRYAVNGPLDDARRARYLECLDRLGYRR